MTETGLPVPDESRPAEAGAAERRRPGRRDYANPHLIALLRHDQDAPAVDAGHPEAAPDREADSDLAPARGIAVGVILGAALWAIPVLLWMTGLL
jgi:hypothetical protein